MMQSKNQMQTIINLLKLDIDQIKLTKSLYKRCLDIEEQTVQNIQQTDLVTYERTYRTIQKSKTLVNVNIKILKGLCFSESSFKSLKKNIS